MQIKGIGFMYQAGWDELQDTLLDSLLADSGNSQFNWSDSELDYLQVAFETTERLWNEAVDRVERPRAVLLGEAPLFGDNGSYIYAEEIAPTAFLWAGDFSAVDKADGGRMDHLLYNDKKSLLGLMNQYGVVVVDAYPYALNKTNTPTLYFTKPNMKASLNKLLKNVFPIFAKPKIALLRQSNPDLQVLVRYKRLMTHSKPLLLEMGFEDRAGPCGLSCVGSNNMGIDRGLFAQALRSAD